MPSKDPDKARSRFIMMVKRFQAGIRQQRERVLKATDEAPRLLAGTPQEVVDLTSVKENDLDYYVYELCRLRDAAREMLKVFDSPPEIAAALQAFDDAIPELRKVRNPLTHASDDARLDDVGSFTAVMRFQMDGRAIPLIDPRYQHHEAAETLADTLLTYLRAGLRSSS